MAYMKSRVSIWKYLITDNWSSIIYRMIKLRLDWSLNIWSPRKINERQSFSFWCSEINISRQNIIKEKLFLGKGKWYSLMHNLEIASRTWEKHIKIIWSIWNKISLYQIYSVRKSEIIVVNKATWNSIL